MGEVARHARRRGCPGTGAPLLPRAPQALPWDPLQPGGALADTRRRALDPSVAVPAALVHGAVHTSQVAHRAAVPEPLR